MINIPEIVKDHLNKPSTYAVGEPDNVFHASGLKCMRQMFRTKAGLVKFESGVLGAMDSGKIVHSHIENLIHGSFVSSRQMTGVEFEKQISSEYKLDDDIIILKGKMDVVSDDIYELKSYGSKILPKKPNDEHIEQLNCYMGITGIQKGHLIYISKLDLSTKQFDVDFDETIFMYSLFKAREVLKKLRDYKVGDEIPFKKCGCYYCKSEG